MEEDQDAHFQSPSEKGHHDDDHNQSNRFDDREESLANWDKSNGNTKRGSDDESRRRLCIKFKVTATTTIAAARDDNNNNEHDHKVCHICNKTFGSGKALGGHMRVHSLSSKKVVHEAKQKPNNNNNNNTDLDLVTCDLCKRCFPSKKSLFGHMRSHPERVWRGIQPPKDSNSTFDSALLKGWSVTAKRGRRSLSSCSNKTASEPLEHDDEEIEQHMEELEAVNELMFLANWNPEKESVSEKDTSKFDDGDQVEFSSSVSLIKKKLKTEEKQPLSYEEGSVLDSHNSNGSTVGMDMRKKNKNSNKKKKKKKGIKKMKLTDLGTAEQKNNLDNGTAKRCNECSTCNKSLPNHRALGGHLRSHRKSNNIQIVNESGSDDVSAATEEEKERTIMQVDETDAVVDDIICNKSFSTVEVLGGHKRSHWTSMTEAQSAQSIQLVENGQNYPKVLNFDLNELPPMDEEEGVQSDLIIPADIMASSGYASSSQNSVTH